MNNKGNYKKGRRLEIVKFMLSDGGISYKGLCGCEEKDKKMYQRVIRQMEKERILRIHPRPKIGCLIDTPDTMEQLEEIAPAFLKAYEDEGKANKYLLTNHSTAERKTNSKRIEKNIITKMFMWSAGVKVFEDDRPKLKDGFIPEEGSYYYKSTEIKKEWGYGVDVALNLKSEKKVIWTRSNGLLLSNGQMMMIYNVESSLIEWRRSGEEKIAIYAGDKIGRIYEAAKGKSRTKIDTALILAKDNKTIFKIILNRKSKLVNIDYTYPKMYAVTMDEKGNKQLTKMLDPGYYEGMKRKILTPEEIQSSLKVRVGCDGYNKETKVYSLLFCLPDIAKLKSFAATANLYKKKESFKIYCYTHQLPLVNELVQDNATIYAMEL